MLCKKNAHSMQVISFLLLLLLQMKPVYNEVILQLNLCQFGSFLCETFRCVKWRHCSFVLGEQQH